MHSTPANEHERLQALRRLELLDTPSEPRFERFTSMAARIFQLPVAVISLVDENRTWFKSCHGLPVQEMPRELSFCARTILDDGVLAVPDMTQDLRFSGNPLVTGDPKIRFYAAAPLIVAAGHRVGALAVMDRRPHHDFRSRQIELLKDLADLVSAEIRQIEQSHLTTAAEQRRHTEEHSCNALIADALSDAVAVVDDHERVVEWNAAARKLFGIDHDQILGKNLLAEIVPVRYCAQLQDEMHRFLTTGRTHLTGRHLEIPLLRASSGEFPAELCVTTTSIDEKILFVLQMRDISGHSREVEEQQKFVSLVENSYDFVSMADFDGRIFFLNRSGRRLVGAPAGELNEYLSLNIFPEDQRRFYGSVVLPAILATGRWQGELQFVNALTDERVDVDATMFHVANRHTGAPLCVATTARDITQQKLAAIELRRAKEVAENAAQAKSLFLANMSHEIRTPMNAVIGMTSLLLDTPLSSEQHEFAETIRNSGEVLLSLIGRVLDFSKIDSGNVELESIPFNLHDCVGGVFDLLAPRAAEKGLGMFFIPDPELPVHLRGDVGRLRQILVNLISNAIKFTETGEISLNVERDESADTCMLLHFTVRDTGIGIEADRFEKIFEAFSQVDSSHTRRFGGTGLGLTISRRLAELMGGKMWVGSQPGKGSSFHFTVEVEQDTAQPERPEASAVLAGRRLLLVCKSPSLRDSFEHYAQMWHMTLEVHTTLPNASAVENHDLVVVDLPPQEAGPCLHQIIAQHGEGKTHFLLLYPMLNHDSRQLQEQAPSWMFFLTHPLKPSALEESLSNIFTAKREDAVREVQPAAVQKLAVQMPLSILLAEDNIVNRKMAEMMFEQLGYRIDTAEDGQEAIEALNRQHYDVIFMDMQMPRVDGVAATRHIRKFIPKSQQPWVIAMTANSTEDAREECQGAGMNDFVSKPVRTNDLRAALERMPGYAIPQPAKTRLKVSPAIYRIYLKSAHTALEELRQCAGSDNISGLRMQAHKLKGSSLVLGISDVATLCSELESLPLEPGQIDTHLGQLAQAIDKAVAEFSTPAQQN